MRVQGDRWLPDPASFAEDKDRLWGDFYVDSEVGRLRSVLLHRPGPELELVRGEGYRDLLFDAPVDPVRFRRQFDALCDTYQGLGIALHFVEGQLEDRPNAIYMRDLYTMTPEGAILARPATAQRRGEERAVARTLAALGVPILKTVNGQGTYEGSNVVWLDRTTCLLGTSSRTNAEGARQVEQELRGLGVTDVLRVAVPYGQIHVDGFITPVDRRRLVVAPWLLTWDLRQELLGRGFELIVAEDLAEVGRLGTNFVAVAPGEVVMAEGFPETLALLRRHEVEVHLVAMDEILRGGGSVHCLTGFLRRDPV